MNRTLSILLLLLLFNTITSAQVNLSNGLVAYYPFNGNANDASGNGLNGILHNGVSFTADKQGNPNSAAHFDGIDDYIQVANNALLNATDGMSIALYFNPEQNGTQTLIGKIDFTQSSGTQFQLGFDYNVYPGVFFGANPSSNGCAGLTNNGAYVNSISPITTNQWYCIVATFEQGTLKMYLNGVLIKSTPAGFTSLNDCSNANLQIGMWWSLDPQRFKGTIDDIRIYNRALNQAEVTALNLCSVPVTCSDWLYTPSQPSYVSIGKLDIPGNQLTVEANFMTTVDNNGVGDLVSKHSNTNDANYLLRAYSGQITTTNGSFKALTDCPLKPDKIYHAAMVYDGTTLKFYRNGFLLKQVPATGNLVQNNWNTWIGFFENQGANENFTGYINQVRIWNIARTQQEIKDFMNSPLLSPTTLPGLQAYFIFDDLANKQGNPSWNGTIGGAAAIGQKNPVCPDFTADSCMKVAPKEYIINDYTEVLGFDTCTNSLLVKDATKFNKGDTILLAQMKGAVIDSSNSAQFGTVNEYGNAGNYEFNIIKQKTGNKLDLLNIVTRAYDIPNGKVQVVRVPLFQNYTVPVSYTLTCLPWDGSKGGVVAVNVINTLTINGFIDVTGKGLSGGKASNSNLPVSNCGQNEYFYPSGSVLAAPKGESIATIGEGIAGGKGAPANAGGGGLDHNSGGGGGSNGGAGGFGGYQLEECANSPLDNRGIGGRKINYPALSNKIFMGGGGGAGHCNNGSFNANGGNGGGIILLQVGQVANNLFSSIQANGADAVECSPIQSLGCHDAGGGGGSGGSILIKTNVILNSLSIRSMGGKGADLVVFDRAVGAGRIGPGGGGGGGIITFSNSALPANGIIDLAGGANGTIILDGNNPWGATSGSPGITQFNLQMPIDNTLFKPNIDSVKITAAQTDCSKFDLKSLGYTNVSPIIKWNWDFGDGESAVGQNITHTYNNDGKYPIILKGISAGGCLSFDTIDVAVIPLAISVSNDTLVCKSSPAKLVATGGISYSWSPAAQLTGALTANPVARPNSTTTFYVFATGANGCTNSDSVKVNIRPDPVFTISGPVSTCRFDTVQLQSAGGDIYSWLPASYLNNTAIADPIANPAGTTTYSVEITDTVCHNSSTLSTTITITPAPELVVHKSNDIDCSTGSSQLTVSGASRYQWSPASTLNNVSIPNPVATPLTPTLYLVKGTNNLGCSNIDSVFVDIKATNKGQFQMPSAFTPNGDGRNDCFGTKYWGYLTEFDFSIFNRWGEKVFTTKNPTQCWDGFYKGVPQKADVYVYIIKAKSFCQNAVFRKGTFALIR